MMTTTTRALMLLVALMVGLGADVDGADNVTYDGRSLIVDGHRKILFSGSIHYPRSTPQMWGSLIAKAKEGGLDVIETYVFWNTHQPLPDQYNFNGRRDIVRFIKEVQAQGLYAVLRIGPFVQAEWSYGGLPFWLHDIPGIAFRSDNEPFKAYMQNFTTKIVRMMQSEKLYASQGGPIILSQIENEYGTIEKAYGTEGKAYVQWAAQMAVGLQTGVPWVMCKQDDAPDPVINTCNGLRCGETFEGPNSPNKPAIWTENWTTHYQLFGEDAPLRSAEDIAFHVTLFILAKNGTFVNYYMYHGGTNFGRQGSEFATTSYYDQAPIDEYGLLNQPKWGHLKEMHAAVKLCLTPILSGVQQIASLGTYGQAFVYTVPSGECAAFLVNNDAKDASVFFQNSSYDLPAKSISILPDCKNVVFNTAKVSTQYNTRTMQQGFLLDGANMWQEFKESIPNFDDTSMRSQTLMEQMNTTKDASDYLWYNFRLEEESSDAQATLNVSSLGHVLHAFVNGQLASLRMWLYRALGSAQGSHANPRFNLESTISLNQGLNNISLLSVMVGLPDSGGHMERKAAGLRNVSIGGEKGNQYFLNYSWGYQVGLVGENLQIYLDQRSNRVQWSNFSNAGNPITWYKTVVDAPPTDLPVALNLGSMGKGEAWVNGLSIGRYWPSYHTPNGSSQIWYHIPRAYLKSTGNLLVVMEEQGGNPLKISLDTAAITQTCSHMTTSFLPSVSQWLTTSDNQTRIANGRRAARAYLACPSTTKISQVLFASYGTPAGSCSTTYDFGSCHSLNSKSIVQKVCLGKRRCSIPVSNQFFGGDPCAGNSKSLLVAVECK